MNKKNTPEKTRQRTLALVAVFVGFLGTSIFAGINVFAAHQKNQDFSQLDAEEKFSRLPEYLLVDRKLLKDSDITVRYSAAKALGELRSKESIPQLTELLKDSATIVRYSAAKALGELRPKESIPQLTELLKDSDELVRFSVVEALGELRAKESIPQLTELLKDSSNLVRFITKRVAKELRSEKKNSRLSIKGLDYEKRNSIFLHSIDEVSGKVDKFIKDHISMGDYRRLENLRTLAESDAKKYFLN
jgi:HEAT repeat protein